MARFTLDKDTGNSSTLEKAVNSPEWSYHMTQEIDSNSQIVIDLSADATIS